MTKFQRIFQKLKLFGFLKWFISELFKSFYQKSSGYNQIVFKIQDFCLNKFNQ